MLKYSSIVLIKITNNLSQVIIANYHLIIRSFAVFLVLGPISVLLCQVILSIVEVVSHHHSVTLRPSLATPTKERSREGQMK